MAHHDQDSIFNCYLLFKKKREYEEKASLKNSVITLLRPQKIVEHFGKDNEGKLKWLKKNVHGICRNNYCASEISLYFITPLP